MTTVPRRVLIADDNADASDSLALLVRCWGYDVRVAYHGSAALDCALEYRPQAALLDLNMPGIDGFRLARALRRQDWFRGGLLVAVTGCASAERQARARQAGFDHFFAKPADPVKLEQLLAGCPVSG